MLRKTVAQVQRETETSELKRSLGPWNLVFLGIGCIIGAGIFVRTGNAAALHAGPAVLIAYRHRRLGLRLCRPLLCRVVLDPAGVGLGLHLQLHDDRRVRRLDHGRASAARIWPCRVGRLGRLVGLYGKPARRHRHQHTAGAYRPGRLSEGAGGRHDDHHRLQPARLPGLRRAGLPARARRLGIGEGQQRHRRDQGHRAPRLHPRRRLHHPSELRAPSRPIGIPFIPEPTGEKGEFGWSGILRAASIVFFAYIGFEAVSTAAQEAKNPEKDMPFGIIGSLVACTIIYILVSIVLTLIVPYTELNVPDPVAVAVDAFGPQWAWFAKTIKVGAIIGLTSVILVLMYGQTRIFYTMARDGLLPRVFAGSIRSSGRPGSTPWWSASSLRRPAVLRHQHPRRHDLGRNAGGLRDRLPDGDLAAAHPPGNPARLSRAASIRSCRLLGIASCLWLITTVPNYVLLIFAGYMAGDDPALFRLRHAQ